MKVKVVQGPEGGCPARCRNATSLGCRVFQRAVVLTSEAVDGKWVHPTVRTEPRYLHLYEILSMVNNPPTGQRTF